MGALFCWFILLISRQSCLYDCIYISLQWQGLLLTFNCKCVEPTVISSFGSWVIISTKLMLVFVNGYCIFTHDCLRVIQQNSSSWLFEGHTSSNPNCQESVSKRGWSSIVYMKDGTLTYIKLTASSVQYAWCKTSMGMKMYDPQTIMS